MPAISPLLSANATELLEQLGLALRERRRSLKVNATAAAEAAGVSRVTLHRIEKGEPSVTAGAYAAAGLAVGLRLQVAPPAAPPAPPDPSTGFPCASA